MRLTTQFSDARWVKSSYSNGNGGGCVEWAPEVVDVAGVVPVRDSKTPEGVALAFPRTAFATFVSALREGAL